MQQPMHSNYVCGINLRSRKFSRFSRKTDVPKFDRNMFIARKVNMTLLEYFLGSYLYHKRRNSQAVA